MTNGQVAMDMLFLALLIVDLLITDMRYIPHQRVLLAFCVFGVHEFIDRGLLFLHHTSHEFCDGWLMHLEDSLLVIVITVFVDMLLLIDTIAALVVGPKPSHGPHEDHDLLPVDLVDSISFPDLPASYHQLTLGHSRR